MVKGFMALVSLLKQICLSLFQNFTQCLDENKLIPKLRRAKSVIVSFSYAFLSPSITQRTTIFKNKTAYSLFVSHLDEKCGS